MATLFWTLTLQAPEVSGAEGWGLSLPFNNAAPQTEAAKPPSGEEKEWRKKSLNQMFADFKTAEEAEKAEAKEEGHEHKTIGTLAAKWKESEEVEQEHAHKTVGEYLPKASAGAEEEETPQEKKTLSELFAKAEEESGSVTPFQEVGEGDENQLTNFLAKAVVLIVIIPTIWIFPWYMVFEKQKTTIDME